MKSLVKKSTTSIKQYGWRDVQELFDYWQSVMGTKIYDKNRMQYYAALRLIKKSDGVDNVKMLINGVKMTIGDRYAPHIGSFIQLEQKVNELIDWGRRRKAEQESNTVF